jgi:hypothetical protein
MSQGLLDPTLRATDDALDGVILQTRYRVHRGSARQAKNRKDERTWQVA